MNTQARIDNRKWIAGVWDHYNSAHKEIHSPWYGESRWKHFWQCVGITLALLLNRERTDKPDYSKRPDQKALAWRMLGRTSSDYGTGWAFAELTLHGGLRFYIEEDSTL